MVVLINSRESIQLWFILAVEPLTSAIRNSYITCGIKTNNRELWIGMYFGQYLLIIDITDKFLKESLHVLDHSINVLD